MLTGPLSRAARALVELTREQLATQCGLDGEAIRAFERGLGDLDKAQRARLKAALEAAGAVFIPENGGGVGVRLKFTRSEARRIATLESEGGIAADDDVP
ncbi:MAG: XRE family transcriptional regulator [Mesorhizobium sp.]|nr:XRE family transcriptional regulator [Mesorhizobium sp.]MCO5162980.1 XRE family transcriptional regulator [Mesorhizobium sp.]